MKRSDLAGKCILLVDVQEGNHTKETDFYFNRILELFLNFHIDRVFATVFTADGLTLSENDFRNRFVSLRSQQIPSYFQKYIGALYLHDGYQFVDDGFLRQLKLFNHGQLPDKVYIMGFGPESSLLNLCLGLQLHGIETFVVADYVSSSIGLDMVGAGFRILNYMIGKDHVIWVDK